MIAELTVSSGQLVELVPIEIAADESLYLQLMLYRMLQADLCRSKGDIFSYPIEEATHSRYRGC
jgi:hypothetical protein